MRVGELKKLLAEYNDDMPIIIDIYEEKMINPRANITRVQEGFDWYSGELIIYTDKKLRLLEDKKFYTIE